jgi:gamma-glutamylcyclotransferase (GGCT)/AIG2-like uncharacterized protein YtfP
MAKTVNKVAVYGTLKEGGALHGHLTSSKQIWKGTTQNKEFCLFNVGWFPALVPSSLAIEAGKVKEGNPVTVEVYEVDDEVLSNLDRAEGYREDDIPNSLYTRQSISLPEIGECFTYIWNRDIQNLSLIESGNFNISK